MSSPFTTIYSKTDFACVMSAERLQYTETNGEQIDELWLFVGEGFEDAAAKFRDPAEAVKLLREFADTIERYYGTQNS